MNDVVLNPSTLERRQSSVDQFLRVPIRMLGVPGLPIRTQPVTFGVPLPRAAAKGTFACRLEAPGGQYAECQHEAVANWPDGSVKWLLLDAIAIPELANATELAVTLERPERVSEAESGIRIRPTGKGLRIDTGVARFHVNRSAERLLVLGDHGRAEVPREAAMFTLIDLDGNVCRPEFETPQVETAGPVRATVVAKGKFPGTVLAFTCRFSFYADTGIVQIRSTLHNPRRAVHRAGLWDLGDAGSFHFKDLTLHVRLHATRYSAAQIQASPDEPLQAATPVDLELYQDSSGGENWQSRNHVNRRGRVPCRFRGYTLRLGREERRGDRAEPLVVATDEGRRTEIAVPEFWQQFPKALEVDPHEVRARLFPKQWSDGFELQGGERKTHTIWLYHGPDQEEQAANLSWSTAPLRASATPEWCARTHVFPYLDAADVDESGRLQPYLSESLRRMLAGREAIDEYGWRNYGDVWGDHEGLHFKGSPPVISHYNNQFDVVNGCLFQFLGTGERAWFDFADALARHVMDIDIYHTREDKAAYNGGLFWFTDHYLDAATSTHRTYSGVNKPRRGAYGGGPGAEHNFATGLLHYYYLTGDGMARESVCQLADWVIAMDDGSRNLLGLVDDGPTGLASHGNKSGPQRAGANSLNVLLDAWTLTRLREYLNKAEELVERCIHPSDDIDRLNLLDAERNWSYTMFLSALARYLILKEEAGQLDRTYAYSRASLLHYGMWMSEHERPYLDAPEKLEYPTEAWAAQELRKANVVRLAARYAIGVVRQKMLDKGTALADRAWRDLLAFEMRYTARAAAVVMAEGPVDAVLRTADPDIPPLLDLTAFEFDPRKSFIPQKIRIRRLLSSPIGWLRIATRLADVRRWLRWLSYRRRVDIHG